MFEDYVLYLLRKYLGEYVHDLSTEALRISVWKGDVVLKDLKLKTEALNSLKLPVIVRAGFIGSITLKVPWKRLGKEPVIVFIDRIFLLAHPALDGQTLKEEDQEKLFEAKLQQIEEAELATLEATTRKSKIGTPPGGNSWLSSLIATIIGNLKISITNVHLRYEDTVSNPGHPFSSGLTLSKLAAVTVDEEGNETFDTSGAFDKLRKSLQLHRLAVYHGSNDLPWKPYKSWEDLYPNEWTEIFADGIDESSKGVSTWSANRKFLISPINGTLLYNRIGKEERNNADVPLEKASLVISDVSLTLTEGQYQDGIKLLEIFSQYKTRIEVSHLRPIGSVFDDPHIWWRYLTQASLQQKQMCYRFSWERIKHLCQLRRKYVQLYASFLQHMILDISEIRQIERNLDSKVILLWRLLAHAKVESVRLKEAAQKKSNLKIGWLTLWWLSSSNDSSISSSSMGKKLVDDERLSKEEWESLNKLLSYHLDEDTKSFPVKDGQTALQFIVDVSIGQAAAHIISVDQTEILCGRFEQLQVVTKLYHKSVQCDLSLRFYGLSAPEGALAESVSSERKTNALAALFVHSPASENVDWRLSATIAPCHVTVLMESYERFLEFLKRVNAVSPAVALETASVLQMKIEQMTRRAQEQLQIVLEEKNRFALDVDFDGPKVRIPLKGTGSDFNSEDFLLDFGHFTLRTREYEREEQRQSLYTRFYISVRDIAALFMDASIGCTTYSVAQAFLEQASSCSNARQFYSLIDRCGMSIIVDMIKIPHPRYPSTRVSVQVPSLSIHISPARYWRIHSLLNMLSGSPRTNNQTNGGKPSLAPWYPAELAANAKTLVWRGIGNTSAGWKPCYILLSRLHLYVLESEVSQKYQRCISVAGRQVLEVPPSSVGGSLFSLAVSCRGNDMQKALESSNTLLINFQSDAEKAVWLRGLVQATYRASSPPDIDVLGDPVQNEPESCGSPISKEGNVDLVVNGALIETSLSIYGKLNRSLNTGEEIILELFASGGKVNLVCSEADQIFKMKLHSLKVKDKLQSRLSMTPQLLACSVLADNLDISDSSHSHNRVSNYFAFEDDDNFKDALSDFASIPDQTLSAQCLDPSPRRCCFHVSDGFALMNSDRPSYHEDRGEGKIVSEVFYEVEDDNASDFVTVNFWTRNPDSPFYDGIDTRMTVCMSKLDFFCNRPTLVALIGFGFDLCSGNSEVSTASRTDDSQQATSQTREKVEEGGSNAIKGLLGHGKGRVVFNLSMDVGSVRIFLNMEDGSRLALFVQEDFLLDIKVHPNSLSIEGSLGNLRLCDLSLGQDHCWGWLCDLRNQGVESLVKFTFSSYSTADDDYKGYDYSLEGHLSSVRIIFIYRFVQEITSYFMELATPHTEEVVRFVDKVGDFEWLIQKYEIDGTSAVKIELSLDTPTIIIPRDSSSKDFLQLDLGQLHMRNSFCWHGHPDDDPSAVHLDNLHVEVHGINMAVGINGLLGKPMIKKAQGLNIYVRRSLRDIFRKVPTAYVEVRADLLHCLMSDKEYKVILECAYMNISEEPKLPPSFRDVPKDPMRILVDKVQTHSQILFSRTVAVVVLEIKNALLDLHNCLDEESPLAHVALEGLWVTYRRTSMFETDIYLTIPKLSVLDIRPDTKPEMRLMLGSSSDASKHEIFSHPFPCDDMSISTGPEVNNDHAKLSILIMDYHFRSSSQSLVVRIQQPRILVVLDFLLPVIEFFVPALGIVTGRQETKHAQNDPLKKCDDIVLSESIYMQQSDEVYLSPTRRLIVDGCCNEFIYDGCGGVIHLPDDSDFKDESFISQSIIIFVGRGKKLRFKNIKFQNGALLRKYVWLGNNSSYSVSADDGVEISLLQSDRSVATEEILDDSQEDRQKFLESKADSIGSNDNKSSSFEIQIMSLELIFYDNTKLSMDDSLHVEKLLRAKMDLSFMYAAKENDLWIRTLLKHLTVEAGTGLVVLDPVDISGGFTSFKNKTSISILSTDVYFRLSLGVASLLLQLQSQATEALQFGSANPLAICTNFKQLWSSCEGMMPGYRLTFWRPQAPSNFAILGDCVTSRPIPPSQVVMAVSTTYGRVRKPVGFKFICSISDLLRLEDGECRSDVNTGCSLWMPIAPFGYSSVGYVAHVGSQPPPNHIVYCIRSDLVSSTGVSDCVFSLPQNSRFPSGFSIWDIDNSVGSFFSHSSTNCPPKFSCFDLHQILLSNVDLYVPFRAMSNDCAIKESTTKHGKIGSSSTSGWNVVRSLQRKSVLSISTPHFERMWWDKGCEFCKPISVWRPLPRSGFSVLGDCIVEGLEPPAFGLLFKHNNTGISARPEQFTKVAHIFRKGFDDAFVWYPIAPPGYVAMGCIITKTDELPNRDLFCCPRMDLVNQANISEAPISRSLSSKGPNCWSIWKVDNQASSFFVRSDLKRPSARLAYNISDFLKPKTRENVSAELKLGCFSITALDSLYGMMAPLLDVTITNINIATHGRLDAMSAVLISSIAASTFNRQLEAWEPLVEPFDGIFKLETYGMNEFPTSRVGKRMRISTTTTVNLNLSSANLEMLIEAIISWKKQMDLQEKSSNKNEEPDICNDSIAGSKLSALEEDEHQRVILENKLGCCVYIRKLEQSSEIIELLEDGKQASVPIPPPQFSNQLNASDETRENHYYVAIQIFESKGLPMHDDGNAFDFFCALRLVVDSNLADQTKHFPQSARTRCVKPQACQGTCVNQGTVKWNEIFIFEIPRKGSATLEVEVTNLASKAGKGEIIGVVSIPIGDSASKLKRVASIRMLQHSSDIQKPFSYPLKPRGQHGNEGQEVCGSLLVSTAFFEKNAIANLQHGSGGITNPDRDVSFWVGLGPDGPWAGFGSLLPASTVPKLVGEKLFAFEVATKNGEKHAILRSHAMVINDTDIKLEISTYLSVLHNLVSRLKSSTAEEKEERRVIDVLIPGSSAFLPWSSMQLDSDDCLQIRPYAEHPGMGYSWGQTVTPTSGSSNHSNKSLTEQKSVSRQGSIHCRSVPILSSVIKLGQLEKKDMIIYSQGVTDKQRFWLSVGTDASVLLTDLNVPVYDWKITINAPLKLDNKLPCNAEFAIWEKTAEGNRVERHHGVLSAGSSEYIYSADLQRPLYLTLFLQGGWILEKDAILIMDVSITEHSSSFWIVHQQSKRKLRVSIERDMGGNDAAPKTVRLFVPYWITNDTSLSLKYRVVEVECLENMDFDLLSFAQSAKPAKSSLKHTLRSIDSIPRKNIQTLEIIESGQKHVMLSPQDYTGRAGILSFPSRNDTFVPPRVGLAVSVQESEHYSPGISLAEIENKERVDVKAFSTNGVYHKLSVLLTMASNRTKIIHFQHQSLFVNKVGQYIFLKQCNSEVSERLAPSDPPRMFRWQSSTKTELLMVRLDGCEWSAPFSVENEGVMAVHVKSNEGSEQIYIRVEVCTGAKISRFEVIFRLASTFSNPYRIVNLSMYLPLRIRQVDGTEDAWQSIPPNAAVSYYWEDLGRQKLLEVLVNGSDPVKSQKYNIDQVMDHQPCDTLSGQIHPLHLSVTKEGKTSVCKLTDWMPDDERTSTINSSPIRLSYLARNDYTQYYSTESEFHIVLEFADVGLSIIDHTPEEILYMTIQNLLLSYSTGLGSGISRFKLHMNNIQVDNQLPFTPMPVLLRPQKPEEHIDHVFKFSVTMQSSGSLDSYVYPYLGLQGFAFLVNIHEPIIWRLHEMLQQAKISRIYGFQTADVSVDPLIQIGLLNISETRFKVSMSMAPAQRPRGVLGFWSSLMTALGNTEHMPVRIRQRYHEGICMHRSALITAAISSVQKDILSQPLQLLSGVDILGNASSAFGNMSKGMAALSMDKKFIQSRQKQDSKGVEDIGDVIREGGGAFAKGLFRGVTGILTKPLEGAKSSGVEGFVQGVGKGIIGAAAQPVSGVLDLLSKTTEGANAVKMKIASALTSEEQLLRRRLTRAIGGDNLLCPYDEYKASGQVILQLAESGAFLGQVDLFKVRGKFALSDAYENHFLLPKGKILVVTHRRVLLLQQPFNIGAQKKFNPARDACSVLWDTLWDDLVTMELVDVKNGQPKSPPSLLILYLKARPFDSREDTRIIECYDGSQQAVEAYTSIEKAMCTYSPIHSKGMQRKKGNKPYSPHRTALSVPVLSKGGHEVRGGQQMPSRLI